MSMRSQTGAGLVELKFSRAGSDAVGFLVGHSLGLRSVSRDPEDGLSKG